MRRTLAFVGLVSTAVCLLAWLVMFLGGNDVWHDTGRADFWHLQGAPYNDLRAVVVASYVLFAGLVVSLATQIASALRRA